MELSFPALCGPWLPTRGKFGAYGEPADVRVIQDKELAGGDRPIMI